MAGPLLVGAEGVLLIPDGESFGASRPIMEGIDLVLQLRHFPTARTIVTVGASDTEESERWCKMNALPEVAVVGIAPEDRHLPPDLAQWYVVERQRAKGPLHLVLTAYETVFERCKLSHQPVLLFARRGALGAAPAAVSWDELHAQVVRRREAAVEAI